MIVDCAVELVRILDEHAAKKEVFRMEEEATKITIDVIGKAICAHDFKCLTRDDNEFVTTLRKTLSWMPHPQPLNPFDKFSKWKFSIVQSIPSISPVLLPCVSQC